MYKKRCRYNKEGDAWDAGVTSPIYRTQDLQKHIKNYQKHSNNAKKYIQKPKQQKTITYHPHHVDHLTSAQCTKSWKTFAHSSSAFRKITRQREWKTKGRQKAEK